MNSSRFPTSADAPRSGGYVFQDELRRRFAAAMSAMYRAEVAQYGALLDLVDEVNAQALAGDGAVSGVSATERARLAAERHGAIRVGSARELGMLRRVFAVMGMQPVGYYDLSVAGVPVHSTAFRPVEAPALDRSPFRMFTSLLRLDLIEERALRERAAALLHGREIFTPDALRLTERFEHQGRFTEEQADAFLTEVLQTFRWHGQATVSRDDYRRMHDAHRLIADVVCFRGPHINQLTPRTLDIDAVQARMARRGIAAKATIEGPPRRKVPILLRQTSFRALAEPVRFHDGLDEHTARFGEVEQRGIALTPEGRSLYDALLHRAIGSAASASPHEHASRLERAFADFPDDPDSIRDRGLGYFHYSVVPGRGGPASDAGDLQALVRSGAVQATPIVYEDFLPVSAAAIFQSNLGDAARRRYRAADARAAFESALGCAVLDEFALYESRQAASIEQCLRLLGRDPARAGHPSTRREPGEPQQAPQAPGAARAAAPHRFLQQLQSIVGDAGGVLTGDQAAGHVTGARHGRGRALCVAMPRSAEQVAQIVALCATAGVGIVPQGAHTGLVGASAPDASGRQLVLSLDRLQRLPDPQGLGACVDFGEAHDGVRRR